MTDTYAVFGNPVAHSRSPRIHQLFAQQTRQQIVYGRQEVAQGGFQDAARQFFATGGKGLNITLPFKQEAFAFAGQCTRRAQQAQAVNTLARQDDGTILGDNTDGAGLVRDIRENLGWPIKAKKILLLGAGGAVRGVLGPIFAENPAEIWVVNRTADRAETLAREFAASGTIIGGGYDALEKIAFDMVINGTSASLVNHLPPLPDGLVTADSCCYDMVYGSKPTPFLAWVRARGVKQLADGLGMLVEQAAESFYLWRGVHPITAPVIATIRSEL